VTKYNLIPFLPILTAKDHHPEQENDGSAVENIETGKPVQVEVAILLDDNDRAQYAPNDAAVRCPWRLPGANPKSSSPR
jgi:hypothetical protein